MAKRVEIQISETLIKSLPSVRPLIAALQAVVDLMPGLEADISRSERNGSVQMARAFVALYLLKSHMDAMKKAFDALYDRMKEERVPEMFELEGVPNVPLEEGYRVQTAALMWVSIRDGMREQAMEFLRRSATASKDGGVLADIIIETINSATLSAAGRHMLAEEGLDLPGHIFKTYFQPTTSVNKIANRK